MSVQLLLNTTIWLVFLFGAIGGKKNPQKYEMVKYSFEFSYTVAINGHKPLVCWYPYPQKSTF